MSTAEAAQETEPGIIAKLQSIKIGGGGGDKVKKKDLVRILSNISTLISNGVSIPQALETVYADPAYKKYKSMLRRLAETVKGGGKLSAALKLFPSVFPSLLVHQVQVGEKAGTIQVTLGRIVDQLENSSKMKSFIIKKLTYPCLLVTAGIGSVTFMMMCVIPTFQKMYEESGAALPWITEVLITASSFVQEYGIVTGIALAIAITAIVVAMKNPVSRLWIDCNILKVPMLGKWLRDLAILQFAETLGNLLDSGFTLVDALPAASRSVTNRYMQTRLLGLHVSLRGGEKFSVAMEREENLFPPVVKQLVVVGERTGRLVEVTGEIRNHLREDVEKTTGAMLGAIEPILTAGLAVVIGGILLAVYLPMFDMIGKTN